MCVEVVFVLFKKDFERRHPDHVGKLRLASGVPQDAIPNKLSDVDISFLIKDHQNLDSLFPATIFKKDTSKPHRTIYSAMFRGREVNVFCTDDEKLAMRSVTHRKNESILAKNFPLVTAMAIRYKRSGAVEGATKIGTELAWVKALGLKCEMPDDAYDIMMNNQLEAGKKREAELEKMLPLA